MAGNTVIPRILHTAPYSSSPGALQFGTHQETVLWVALHPCPGAMMGTTVTGVSRCHPTRWTDTHGPGTPETNPEVSRKHFLGKQSSQEHRQTITEHLIETIMLVENTKLRAFQLRNWYSKDYYFSNCIAS